MELLSLRLTPSPSASTSSLPAALAHCSKLCEFQPRKKKKVCFDAPRLAVRCVKASAQRTGDTIDDGETRTGFTTPAMEVTTFNRSTFSDAADFPVWEKIGAVVRLSYGLGE